ncbi:type II secretion system F family protein [Anaerosoma tenue]|uniref:type II secretion system F family protein n=1 Tax=Anaerosoma tenue TaxID=2933588 RepID=UPI002260DFC8|nr:type II secretion system F family protein [Anaerosoma tenue]MCK8114729.1 type II secretion system F family protein [Anaerosoma tenue]
MRRRIASIALVAALVCSAGVAFAQGDSLVVRHVSVAEFPRVWMQVDVPAGDGADAGDFRILENGHEAEILSAEAVEADPMDVFLVVDTSGSMRGASLDAAKSAALAFVEELQNGSRVAVLAFSETARVVAPIGGVDAAAVGTGVDALEARGETALYDALRLTADEAALAGVERPIAVVLSDGGDTVSRTTLDDAVKALRSAGVPVLVVALPSAEADAGVLETIAAQTGGRFVGVAEADALTEVYQDLARGLQTTWDVTFVSRRPSTKDIDVQITFGEGDSARTGSTLVPNPLFDASSEREVRTLDPVPPASIVTLAGAGALVFVSVFALVAGVALVLVRPKSALDRIRYYDQMQEGAEGGDVAEQYSSRVTSSVMGAVDYVAGKRGINTFVYEQLDRAGWPLRPTEYIVMHLAIVIVAGVLAMWVSGSVLVGILVVVAAVIVPLIVVDARIRSRHAAFEAQLPDVLNLIAGALRAGWGLQQSIDLVVEQMSPPVSSEFARAQTEVRLGRSVEEALETVARRTQSEDFSWAVTAIGIQRDVGGNLAEVLDVVAATIRDRGALKRQISGLTAEGRLSAWILLVLPFVLVFTLSVLNPAYMLGLFTTVPGLVMIAIGSTLLVVGAVWLRNIVTIEV